MESIKQETTIESLHAMREVLIGQISEFAENVGRYGEGNFAEDLEAAIEELRKLNEEIINRVVEAGKRKGQQGELKL